VKTDRRSYSLEDDSPEVKLEDFDDFATSKPGEEPERRRRTMNLVISSFGHLPVDFLHLNNQWTG
jgi:hypothetical protein